MELSEGLLLLAEVTASPAISIALPPKPPITPPKPFISVPSAAAAFLPVSLF